MNSDKIFDLIGIVSEIGLLSCFGAAVCFDVAVNNELLRIVGISSAVFLTTSFIFGKLAKTEDLINDSSLCFPQFHYSGWVI